VSEIKGAATRHGVSVEVHPGGAMTALRMTPAALDLGATVLAATVVEAVATATAQANQRTKHALRTALAGLDLSALGLTHSAALTEQAESTVPDTWRAQ
jgi:DNA-binding protein YbaB